MIQSIKHQNVDDVNASEKCHTAESRAVLDLDPNEPRCNFDMLLILHEKSSVISTEHNCLPTYENETQTVDLVF
jgi:hypothetical protein